VHVLRFIKRARTLGFAVDDIKQLLALWQNKSRPSAAVKKIARDHIDALKRKIGELESMVEALEHLARNCHGDERPHCPILEDLAQ
jgi:DNA-binding transcriptional MerR regulator